MIGQTIAHYNITAKLGAGGMGEVYRATDTKLGRDVALKILPAEMASDPQRLARFQREARTIAALNHPHIVTIFSVEESGGRHFLTMELVEGQPLNRCIPESGLPLQQLVEIAIPLAGALAAAHEKSIVHRDLKPANVMLTGDGRVKVLDFGLAKETRAPSDSDATLSSAGNTEAGIVMGTPAYMSPEQVAGRVVDHRTDIFSLGILLYEMATGRRPFEGRSSIELASSILRDTPTAVTEVRADLPGDLARIIRRCLEKDPRNRIQTALDVANEFREMARPAGRAAAAPASRAATASEELSVVVLPFKSAGGDADLAALAEGLTEDITTGLSRFSYLHVIAHQTALTSGGATSSGSAATKALNARYLLEGSVRKSGKSIRVSARVTDTATGEHLWAENYDRAKEESFFAIQDEITAKIVSTVGDSHGALPRAMGAVARRKPSEQVTPYEAVLRQFAYNQLISAEEHAIARACLERAVEQAPDYADAWASLALLYLDEFKQNFNLRPDPLGRAAAAIARALALDPANALAYNDLATTRFFQKDFDAFRPACERAIALNPMDGSTKAWMGILTAYAGDWERGLALTEEALALNPHHPGWYRFAQFFGHYRKREYQEALGVARRINMPTYFYYHAALAAALGQLGRREEAQQPIRELLKAYPNYPAEAAAEMSKWLDRDFVQHWLEGLRKAGIEVLGLGEASPALPAAPAAEASNVGTISGFGRRPAIAVLPFQNLSGDPEQEYFADGVAEDLITRLSLWRSFPVIARNSSFAFRGQNVDVKQVAAELAVRYVVRGSVRKAGNRVRIAAQLLDAATGQNIWAQTYDRELTDVFAVQDEISEAIATPLASDLQRAEHERVKRRAPDNLEAWELYQRALPLLYRFTRDDSAQARVLLERATELDAQFAPAIALLSEVGVWEFIFNWTEAPQKTLDRAVAQARRAVELDPRDAQARTQLAFALMTAGDGFGALEEVRRGMELNPSLPFALLTYAYLRNLTGHSPEESIALVHRAMRLSPRDPLEWLFYDVLASAYFIAGRHADGLAAGRRLVALSPSYYWGYLWSAMNAVGLGQMEQASEWVRQARQIQPDLSVSFVRQALGALAAEVDRRFSEALLKAGLDTIGASGRPSAEAGTGAARSDSDSGRARVEEGFWIAVLPLRVHAGDAEVQALADGLTEDITAALSQFSHLSVMAAGSTLRATSREPDMRAAASQLGARYLLEGAIRKSGTSVRLSARLVDTQSGANLWAETFNREWQGADSFAVQDDLTDRIAATVADANGVLVRSMLAAVQNKRESELTAREWVLRLLGYRQTVDPVENLKIRTALEGILAKGSKHAPLWACLAQVYVDEYSLEYHLRPDALDRAYAAARRAVDIDRTCQLGHLALAQCHYFRRDAASFSAAAERTLAINPRDSDVVAEIGLMTTFGGEFQRGVELTRRAMQLNPNHAGWFHFSPLMESYSKQDYEKVLEHASRVNMPGFYWLPAVVASVYGHLGRAVEGHDALRELLGIDPDFARHGRRRLAKWLHVASLLDAIMVGLRKAGLEIAEDPEGATLPTAPSAEGRTVHQDSDSGRARLDDGFWVAVLPFKCDGTNADLAALAEGLTEEILTGLSRFSYLRVIARGSTAKYSSKSGDVRDIGTELGARYVMEGSLRKSGSIVRVSAQLLDVATGTHLWAETYDRELSASNSFALQDELTAKIVSTAADTYGVLPRSLAALAKSKPAASLSPYEAVLRSFSYWRLLTAEEHLEARDCLERAVENEPAYADAWAELAIVYADEHKRCFNPRPDSLQRALTAARRAVALNPANHLAQMALAQTYYFLKDFGAFRPAAERAVALNPLDGNTLAHMGELIACSGDWEAGISLVDRALSLNPHHPGRYYFSKFWNFYFKGQYQKALEMVQKFNLPDYFYTYMCLAAVNGQLGNIPAARAALKELLNRSPNFSTRGRTELAKWHLPDSVELAMEGLRKAGLEIPDTEAASSDGTDSSPKAAALDSGGGAQESSDDKRNPP